MALHDLGPSYLQLDFFPSLLNYCPDTLHYFQFPTTFTMLSLYPGTCQFNPLICGTSISTSGNSLLLLLSAFLISQSTVFETLFYSIVFILKSQRNVLLGSLPMFPHNTLYPHLLTYLLNYIVVASSVIYLLICFKLHKDKNYFPTTHPCCFGNLNAFQNPSYII